MDSNLKELLKSWPKDISKSVERLTDTYGQPQEYSESFIVWFDCKPWKRTVVTKNKTPHNFPHPHSDFVQQFIDYKVPIDSIDDLARFDGSIVVDRTRGELSARCGGTSMNFVAINLAHDIIKGTLTLEEAREDYDALYHAFENNEKPDYTQKFMFKLPKGNQSDAGQIFVDMEVL